MQVPAPMIWMIQQLVDSALTLDPQVRQELNSLDQKIIEIEENRLGLTVYFLVVDQTVQILGYYDGEVDTTIRGSARALLLLSRDTGALIAGDVEIEGDLEVGRAIRRLITLLDIDWEEQLSKISGDTVAHQVGRLHRSFIGALSRTGTEFREDSREYLIEESGLLVAPKVLSTYLEEIDKLRDDAERLEVRLSMLEDKLGRGE